MPDIRTEIKYRTARSGGKGGQNVNKVETMAEGYWLIEASTLMTDEQKKLLHEKLVNKNKCRWIFVGKKPNGKNTARQ